jgi:hypothetical protein
MERRADDGFKLEVTNTLSRLEAHMESLVGNGQPGRISKLEDGVSELRESQSRWKGIVTGISVVIAAIGALVHFIFRY